LLRASHEAFSRRAHAPWRDPSLEPVDLHGHAVPRGAADRGFLSTELATRIAVPLGAQSVLARALLHRARGSLGVPSRSIALPRRMRHRKPHVRARGLSGLDAAGDEPPAGERMGPVGVAVLGAIYPRPKNTRLGDGRFDDRA